MRVLVCGGRDYENKDYLFTYMNMAHRMIGPFTCVIHGAAKGADTLAQMWAVAHNVRFEAYPADWKTHGKAAGPIRNQQMLAQKPDLVIAFPGGTGTADMVNRARKAGVRVIELGQESKSAAAAGSGPNGG